VTSNKAFGRWGEVFSDDVVAAAMIDRLVHHAEVVALKGDSYRLRNRDLGRVPIDAPVRLRLILDGSTALDPRHCELQVRPGSGALGVFLLHLSGAGSGHSLDQLGADPELQQLIVD
jgi:hypothetical protein